MHGYMPVEQRAGRSCELLWLVQGLPHDQWRGLDQHGTLECWSGRFLCLCLLCTTCVPPVEAHSVFKVFARVLDARMRFENPGTISRSLPTLSTYP